MLQSAGWKFIFDENTVLIGSFYFCVLLCVYFYEDIISVPLYRLHYNNCMCRLCTNQIRVMSISTFQPLIIFVLGISYFFPVILNIPEIVLTSCYPTVLKRNKEWFPQSLFLVSLIELPISPSQCPYQISSDHCSILFFYKTDLRFPQMSENTAFWFCVWPVPLNILTSSPSTGGK